MANSRYNSDEKEAAANRAIINKVAGEYEQSSPPSPYAEPFLRAGTYEDPAEPFTNNLQGSAPDVAAFEDDSGITETLKYPEKYKKINGLSDSYPDDMGYVAPSLAPKDAFTEEPGYDRSPLDSPKGKDYDTEKRYLLRTYLEQKYANAAKDTDVKTAMERERRTNNIADVGHSLDRMVTAHSAARGGQGADDNYWRGMKQDAGQEVQKADAMRRAKIQDYLAKQKLGVEGVEQMQKIKEYENKNEMKDPSSNASKMYQLGFKGMFPEMADNFKAIDEESGEEFNAIDQMSANDIMAVAKMYQAKSLADSNISYRSAQVGAIGAKNDPNSPEGKMAAIRQKTAEANQKTAESNQARAAIVADAAKNGKNTTNRLAPEKNFKFGGQPVLKDAYGNFYTMDKKRITDTSKLETVDSSGNKASTESQAKAGEMWARAREANDELDSLAANQYPAPSNMLKQAAADNYIMANGLARQLYKKALDENDLIYANSTMNFINAVLRRDSGASIQEQEFTKYKPMLPEAGDSPAILAKKKNLRALEIKALETSAGDKYTGALNKSLGQSKGPKVGEIDNGYEFLGGDPADSKSWRKAK